MRPCEDRKRIKQETGAQCRWSGRRLIEFAAHGPTPFLNTLRGVLLEHDAAANKALRKLRQLDRHSEVSKILEGFATAKNMLEARFVQYTTFLSKPPWSLVALLEFLLPNSTCDSVAQSRALAAKMVSLHDHQHLGNLGDVGNAFFIQHRTALTRWARGHDHFMQQQLFRQLVGWASSLLVMKRLEAKHHLVHAT